MVIHKTNRREVALHSPGPLVVFQNHVVIFAVLREVSGTGNIVYLAGEFFAESGQVVSVIVACFWEDDFIQRMQIEIFFWDKPRQVRFRETAGEEEGFILFFVQFGDGPVDDLGVGEVAVFVVQRTPRCPRLGGKFVGMNAVELAALGPEVIIP